MQMLRIGDSSMINQTGSKLLHKAMPLQVSSLLPDLSIWETCNILSVVCGILRRTPCFPFVSDPGVLCPLPASMEL